MGFTLKNKNNQDRLKISSSIFNQIRKVFLCILFEKKYEDISSDPDYYFNEIKKKDESITFFFVKKDTHGTFKTDEIQEIISFFNNHKNEIYALTGIHEHTDFIFKPFIDYIDKNKENKISYWNPVFITV